MIGHNQLQKQKAPMTYTEKLGQEFPDIIAEVKLNRRLPLIVEVPDRHGTGRDPNFIPFASSSGSSSSTQFGSWNTAQKYSNSFSLQGDKCSLEKRCVKGFD